MPPSTVSSLLIALCVLLRFATANVEKEIFLGPPSPQWWVPWVGAEMLRLASSEHCTNCRAVRARLDTSFTGRGAEHWVLLSNLEEGRRYEVRICWPATQPTDFTLELYTPAKVRAKHGTLPWMLEGPAPGSTQESGVPVLYLSVLAKTTYFSSNESRMANPDPVDVDIILDPYLFNVFPESLLRIGGLVVVVAVFSWFLAGWIHRALLEIARPQGMDDPRGKRKDL